MNPHMYVVFKITQHGERQISLINSTNTSTPLVDQNTSSLPSKTTKQVNLNINQTRQTGFSQLTTTPSDHSCAQKYINSSIVWKYVFEHN